jgi:hypothetical protein
MKIKGFDLAARPYDEATFNVLGQEVTFRAQIVTDFAAFDTMFPEPKAPIRTTRDGITGPNLTDKGYKKAVEDRNQARFVFMLAKSLLATPDLAFEFINVEDVATLTMDNLTKEFSSAGFPDMTTHEIINLATSANGLTAKMVGVARQSFFTTTPQEPNLASDQPDQSEQ